MQHKKALLIICLVIVLVFVTLAAFAKPKLSDMSDEELIQYVTDAGVTIPSWIPVRSVRLMIKELEKDPEYPTPVLEIFPSSHWFDDLREVVKAYYGIEP